MSLATLRRTPTVSDELQYRLIHGVTFPFFLLVAVVQRPWRRPTRSILAEARAASANALLFAFQG